MGVIANDVGETTSLEHSGSTIWARAGSGLFVTLLLAVQLGWLVALALAVYFYLA